MHALCYPYGARALTLGGDDQPPRPVPADRAICALYLTDDLGNCFSQRGLVVGAERTKPAKHEPLFESGKDRLAADGLSSPAACQ